MLFETRPALGIYFLGGIAIVLVSTLLGLLLYYGAPSLGASASAAGGTSLLQALGLIAIALGILGLAALSTAMVLNFVCRDQSESDSEVRVLQPNHR